jgi:predicted amidohydrolase/GNAT superfamily N-acetyltransferase
MEKVTATDVPPKQPRKTGQRKEKPLKHKLKLRQLRADDYAALADISEKVYRNSGGSWRQEQFNSMLAKFPEGQLCIEDKGRVVACALSLVVKYDKYTDLHTYDQITGNGFIANHEPDGDSLYGMDVFVDPEFRGLRLGRRLYDARKELCQSLNLKRIVAGGWMPGYPDMADKMTPQQYIEQVKEKKIYDPVLTFQIANGFHVRKILTNYWAQIAPKANYAILLEWINIYYIEEAKLVGARKSLVRVGVVQWQMRPFNTIKDMLKQAEFFVDTVSGYNADFIVFPELFNVPLMAEFKEAKPSDAMRYLAAFTDMIRDEFLQMALSYNINIIGGSMPVLREDTLYNVALLCRRDGTWEDQDKIHITPSEANYWGFSGGNKLTVFDTDVGKIGILICYDVEFPELSRILAERGVNILFVPFSTDTKNAFLRVKHCAMARAVENECYVVISGSVGNLPNVENLDIQYAQSAVFTPSDISFPQDAVIAEAVTNTEMTLIADLNLELLKELRTEGSVRNMRDRRLDLYKLQWIETETGIDRGSG